MPRIHGTESFLYHKVKFASVKLDKGHASAEVRKSELFLHRYSNVSNPHEKEDEIWEPHYTREFNAYFSKHSQDFCCGDTSQPFNTALTMDELSLWLENLKSTLPGSDVQSSWLLKECSPVTRQSVLLFFNEFFSAGHLPKDFKRADD